MKIVVVGSIAYDAVETPAGKRESQLGGSACFFSISASYFTDVGIIGVVGEDFASSDRSMLESHGIDTTGLVEVDGKTFRIPPVTRSNHRFNNDSQALNPEKFI